MEFLQASQFNSQISPQPLVAVIALVMFVIAMAAVVVRPSRVVGPVVRITPVITVVAAWVIYISRIPIVAVTISGITEADSSDPD